MKISFRLPETYHGYQVYKSQHSSDEMLADWQNRIVEEFTYWAIITNKFPWDKLAHTHHLLIPKRRFAHVEDMTPEETEEWIRIRRKIHQTYDMFVENMIGTVHDVYHPHLVILKEETDPAYFTK